MVIYRMVTYIKYKNDMIQINLNIQIPKNCFECPLIKEWYNLNGTHICCSVNNKYFIVENAGEYNENGTRPDWCILKEVRR